MALGRNIEMLRKAKELPVNALARSVGTSPQAIHNLEKRDSSQSSFMLEIANALGVSYEDLITKDFATVEMAKDYLESRMTAIRSDDFASGRQGAIDADDEATVTISSATASMGLGDASLDDEVLRMVKVRKTWLKQALPAFSSIDSLGILTARGDSMKPTFNDGDQLIVDCGVREVKYEGVYVITRFGDLFVKRIQVRLQDGSIVIKSDNSLFYEPEVIAADDRDGISVLGRVLWAWTGTKL